MSAHNDRDAAWLAGHGADLVLMPFADAGAGALDRLEIAMAARKSPPESPPG